MPALDPPQANEPAYGATTAADQQSEASPMPQALPGATPEAIADQTATPQTPAKPAETSQTAQPEAPPGYTVKNRFMLLPPGVNFQNQSGNYMQPPKTPVEQNYDTGMLWNVLASSPSSDPLTQELAKRLMGGS